MSLHVPLRKYHFRHFFIFILLLHAVLLASAQTGPHDFEFWIGVPQWDPSYKTPQQIHFTGSGSSTSYYEIDMPANPAFTPIAGSVAPGASGVVNMTSLISQIETSPANTVLNRGLRIKIWGKMGGYYANENVNNYGSLPLRGPNALGTEFIVPGQDMYANGFSGGKLLCCYCYRRQYGGDHHTHSTYRRTWRQCSIHHQSEQGSKLSGSEYCKKWRASGRLQYQL